jgi:hypothetical protein
VVTAGFPSLKIFCEVPVMQPVNQHFNTFLDGVMQSIFPEIFQVGNDAPSITDDAVTDGSKYFFIRVINQMKQSFYFFGLLHGVDVFSSGDIQSGVNGMNIAEVKKNTMTILSTNPLRMFISVTVVAALIG